MPKTQYSQKFRKQWLRDPNLKNWLEVIESTTGETAKCKLCKQILRNHYNDLKTHGTSKKHKARETVVMEISSKQQILPFKKQSEMLDTKVAECKLTLFIAAHCSIRVIDHLSSLCKGIFKGDVAENLQIHRTKCTAIICNVLAPYFKCELVEDIGNSPYSILIDESTDISVFKYLGITIKYFSFSKNKIINSYLGLIPLHSCDSEGITEAVVGTIRELNLNINNLRGIGTDNAAVMTGINNGVYQKLKQTVPHLILIKCICHSLQLAVNSASKIALPRNLEFLIKETYLWFSNSTYRQSAYKEIYNLMNDGHDPLKLVQICNTRWLSIETAMSRIYEQWNELKAHFDVVRNKEKCYTAEMLYTMYNDKVNYAYICFLKPVLSDVQAVNKAFESNKADPTKLLKDLSLLIESLIQKIVLPGNKFDLFSNKKLEDYVDANCYLGYKFENEIKNIENDVPMIRQRCIHFILELIKEIKHRLPENMEILKNIDMLSVENTLKTVKADIRDLLMILKVGEEEIQKIEDQWRKINLINWKSIGSTIEFWIEVVNYKNSENENPFLELSHIAITVLTLPHSNADVERLFSQMNLIKSKLRNRMKLPLLDAILSIRAGMSRFDKCCTNFDVPEEVVKKIGTSSCYQNLNIDDDTNLDICTGFLLDI